MKNTVFIVVCLLLMLFMSAFATDLSDLTEDQKKQLRSYNEDKALDQDDYFYTSQTAFDEKPAIDISSNKITVEPPLKKSGIIAFEDLLPFGMNLFENLGLGEVPIGIAAASDYILGPGDNVIIYLWGRVDKEISVTFDREGKVFIPKVGEIIGWGLSIEEFTRQAKQKFKQVYTEFELTVSLGKIRSIQIYVTGEVNQPGAYNVSSLTSILNALFLAGGPSENGTLRKIQLRRTGELVVELDLYELLLEGNNSDNVRLFSGDVIFVPIAGNQVAITGAIRRPAIYELKADEKVLDLLRLAGNPTPQAHLERIMLERITDNGQVQLIDLNLKDENGKDISNIALKRGDKLTIYSIFQAKLNTVAIFGLVKHAGYYERTDSLRISDIVSQAKLQPYDVYLERADLFRRYPDFRVEIMSVDLKRALNKDIDFDYLLQDLDSLHIYSIKDVERKKYVYVEGEVKNPGSYPLYDNMTVADLIFLAGLFTKKAILLRGEIARLDDQAEITLIDLDLSEDRSQAIKLNEDDRLYIRQIPEWQVNPAVTISGEIKFPGNYTLSDRSETLWQIIQRSGGFTMQAFPKGLILRRASIRSYLDRTNISEIIDKSVPVVIDSLGNVKKEDEFDFNLNSMDRIIIDMDRLVSSNGKEGDIILRPGDNISIPTIPPGISVIGAIGANGTINFTPDKNVKYYLKHAGSYTKNANKKQTRLVMANGKVFSGRGIEGRKVELGGIIVVPTKIRREKDTLKTISEIVGAVTGILTSVYIVSKL